MDRIDALRVFASVATKGSFAEAARSLQISTTSASRAIAVLEDELGVALLRRTTRSVGLTPEGEVYLERCRHMLDVFDDAARTLRGQDADPRGLLVVTSPVVMARRHVRPVLKELLIAHPQLRTKLLATDRVIRIVEEGVDVAVRIGNLSDSALTATRLGETRLTLVASPAYIERHGAPASLKEVEQHALIAFDNFTHNSEWRFRDGQAVRVEPRLLTNDVEVAADAALAGLGLTYLFSYMIVDQIKAGALVPLLADAFPDPVPINAVFPANRRRAPNVRAFLGAIRSHLASANL